LGFYLLDHAGTRQFGGGNSDENGNNGGPGGVGSR
jgi:hypothetical protein